MTSATTKNKLKIAFVLDDGFDSIDGVQRNILTLGDWLIRNGHSVKYLVGATKRTDIDNIIPLSKNLRVRYNGNVLSISLYSSKKEILKVLNKEKFDVVHIQVPYSPFMGAKVIKHAAKNSLIVGTFHILPYKKFHNIGNYALGFWLRNNLKLIDLKYSVSLPAATFAKKTHNFDSEILPNPVDVKSFSTNAQPRNKSEINIVFLGRLVPRKGCKEFLRVIKFIKANSLIKRDFKVHICGHGHQESELKRYVSSNGLSENVIFHGFVSEKDKIKMLQNANVAVFPAIEGESFGIVLIEAMAAKSGVVLAANNPGYKSVLGSIPEVIFNPKDVESFANLVAKSAVSDTFADSVHSKQQSLVASFDINKIGSKLLSYYKVGLQKKFG
ncbi:glycosyltransferase family 4 protein [Candidatus Saccharibacteria bacterium]|nr:glycosyltransferase family 4 protein [Candidatus Saccharibacteria bacterium]